MNQINNYGWYGDEEDTDDVYYMTDLPVDPEPKEPIVCPQCWDENEYDGDKILEITEAMCRGVR